MKEEGTGKLDYKWICTKETPWDMKTLPVLHKEGRFMEEPAHNFIHCPVCGHTWTIGPDIA